MTHDTGRDLAESFRLYVILLRELNDWRQSDLAAMLGITQGAVSKLETGRMAPNGEVILRAYRHDPYLFNRFFDASGDYKLLISEIIRTKNKPDKSL